MGMLPASDIVIATSRSLRGVFYRKNAFMIVYVQCLEPSCHPYFFGVFFI